MGDGLVVKNLPANAGDLAWEDPLEGAVATSSIILTREVVWTEEPCRLQPMGSKRVDLVTKQQFLEGEMISHSINTF